MDLGELIVSLPIIKWILGSKEEITPAVTSDNDLFEKMWEAADNNCGEEGTPLEVTLKNNTFDTSKIPDYIPPKKPKTHKFTPSKWDEYIGQVNAKKIIQSFIKGSKENEVVFPHTIIDGKAGLGKTTLVYLIKKYLDVDLIEHIASDIVNLDQLVKIFAQINSPARKKDTILFIDEVHNLSPQLIEIFYPILQEGHINDKEIRPFTFIGCTTEKGKLIRKFKPFVSRMGIQITLEDYSVEEMKTIITQFKNKVFPEKEITNEIYTVLAKCSRLCPRDAVRLIKSYFYIGNLDETLQAYTIVDKENGLTKTDFKILEYLANNDKVGLQGLSAYLGISQENYLYQYEQYLIQLQLITRTPRGRSIGNKGKEILKEV